MRCCDCEFRNLCDKAETVLTAFVSCEKRTRLLAEQRRKQTNADRIRSMSDEKMARWLAEWSFCADACPASTNEVEEAIGYCCPSNCKEQALTWLQQPAEEEPNGKK